MTNEPRPIIEQHRVPFDRRRFLQGVGTCVAIPVLESLVPSAVLAAAASTTTVSGAPLRMAFMSIPNGVQQDHWFPTGDGKDFTFSTTLQPLEPVRICYAPFEAFDFLGYSFGVQYRFGSGRPYVAAYPSKASVRRLKGKLRRMIGNHMSWQSAEELIGNVNRVVRGWLNYFSYGTLWKTYTKLESFLQSRVRGWLVHKHRVGSRGLCQYPAKHLYETLGLIYTPGGLRASRKPSG